MRRAAICAALAVMEVSCSKAVPEHGATAVAQPPRPPPPNNSWYPRGDGKARLLTSVQLKDTLSTFKANYKWPTGEEKAIEVIGFVAAAVERDEMWVDDSLSDLLATINQANKEHADQCRGTHSCPGVADSFLAGALGLQVVRRRLIAKDIHDEKDQALELLKEMDADCRQTTGTVGPWESMFLTELAYSVPEELLAPLSDPKMNSCQKEMRFRAFAKGVGQYGHFNFGRLAEVIARNAESGDESVTGMILYQYSQKCDDKYAERYFELSKKLKDELSVDAFVDVLACFVRRAEFDSQKTKSFKKAAALAVEYAKHPSPLVSKRAAELLEYMRTNKKFLPSTE